MTWEISEGDLHPIAIGAAVLGTGGGGNPYLGMLRARELARRGLPFTVVAPDEIPDDATLVAAGGMGAPVVSFEKLAHGEEEVEAVRALEVELAGKVDVIAPLEMGGGNSMAALIVAAQLGIPVLDGDGMGRAFPELQMCTYLIYGASPSPAALADERGARVVVTGVRDAHTLERIARAVTIEMGGHSGLAMAVMDAAHARRSCVPDTLTLAKKIGDAVLGARGQDDPVAAILRVTGGRALFSGKVVDLERRVTKGFARGHMTLEGAENDLGDSLTIEFQNENLAARRGDEILAVVPDLITVVDADTGEPITTEVVRYGFRVVVLVLPPSPVLTTTEALRWVGPRAFGYDVDYAPVPGV